MLGGFKARLNAIRKALDDEAVRQSMPVDPLSASLYEMGAYLDGLDAPSLEKVAEEWGISVEDVRSMAHSYRR